MPDTTTVPTKRSVPETHLYEHNDTLNAKTITLIGSNGEPVTAFKGALSMYDSDVNSVMVNEHLRRETGVNDTLTANAAVDTYDLTVTTGANYPPNTRIILTQNGDRETATLKVITQVGNVLTIDKPLEHDYTAGAIIQTIIKDMSEDGHK